MACICGRGKAEGVNNPVKLYRLYKHVPFANKRTRIVVDSAVFIGRLLNYETAAEAGAALSSDAS